MSSPLAVLRRLRPPADADTLSAYARTRDPLLLAELVRRHGGLVWGVCRRALPHRPDAEDAYQATWLVLVANPGAVRSPAALPAFLHAVAVRTSRRVRQKRPLTAAGDHLPAREPADRDHLAALDAELADLPDKLRRPLVLCHLDGVTQEQAARALGLSLSTLKRRLEAGKELLRVRLAGRGVDVSAGLATAGLMGVGAPTVTAGGAGVAATAISTEVLSAMWMLKAKGWAAGLVLAAGVSATGGGLMLAGGQGPGGRTPAAKPADPPAAGQPVLVPPPTPVPASPLSPEEEKILREQLAAQQRYIDLDKQIRAVGAITKEEEPAFMRYLLQAYKQRLHIQLRLATTAAERQTAIREAIAEARSAEKYFEGAVAAGQARLQQALDAMVVRYEFEAMLAAELRPPQAAATAVPSRLLKERIDAARKYIDLDRQIREVGAISREEASAFEINLRLANQTLYDAMRISDPSPAGQLAAAREWYVNTRDAEHTYRARADRGLCRELVALASSLARNQAETALLQTTAAAPPAARDGIAPFAAAPVGYMGKVTKIAMGYVIVGPDLRAKPAAVRPVPPSLPPGVKSDARPDPRMPPTAVRVSRASKPVGMLVLLHKHYNEDRNALDELEGVMLPNLDGTVPTVQVGDDVRP